MYAVLLLFGINIKTLNLKEAPAPAETPAAPAEVKEEAVKVGVWPQNTIMLGLHLHS